MLFDTQWCARAALGIVLGFACMVPLSTLTLAGHWWIAIGGVWFISPIVFATVSRAEGRTLRSVFNLRTQSWAFVLGDIVLLPLMFAMLAVEAGRIDADLNPSLLSVLIYFGVGVAMGVAFHWNDTIQYRDMGYGAEACSLGKITHDLFIYPALAGSAVCVAVVEFMTAGRQWLASPYVWAASLALVGWLMLGLADAKRAPRLIPWGHIPS